MGAPFGMGLNVGEQLHRPLFFGEFMKQTANYYFMHYVENSTPKLAMFSSKEKAYALAAKIEKKPSDDGYWVDFIIKGELLAADNYYLSLLHKRSKSSSKKTSTKK